MNERTQHAPRKSSDIGPVLALCALALAMRVGFWAASPRIMDSADAIHYVRMAEQFAGGQWSGFDARIPPLYPAISALVATLGVDGETACLLVSLVASVLLLVPAYGLARAMHGRAAAIAAGLTVALWPWLIDYGSRVGPEALATALWFAAVWALARAMRQGGVWIVAAPLFFFALHLARPEGTFLLLAAPIGALILCVRGGDGEARRLVPFIAIAATLMVAYVVLMRMAVGEATLNPRTTDMAGAVRHILFQRGEQTAKTAISLFADVLPVMVGPYLLIFAGVGLFRPSAPAPAAPRDIRLELLLVYFAAAQWGLAVLSTYPSPRYLMPVVVAAGLWAGRGMAAVGEQAAGQPNTRWLRGAPLVGMAALMLLGVAVATVPEHLGRTPRQPVECAMAGRWMKAQGLPAGLILSRKPWVGFYAGMETVGPPDNATVEGAIAFGREAGARYFVIDERYSAAMIPGLRALLDPANAPSSLRLLKADLSPYADARIVIYEILPP